MLTLIHFYPRSPCGERLCIVGELEIYQHISIHALLAESDYTASVPPASLKIFLSTLSLRRATPVVAIVYNPFIISIHALLAESDWFALSP